MNDKEILAMWNDTPDDEFRAVTFGRRMLAYQDPVPPAAPVPCVGVDYVDGKLFVAVRIGNQIVHCGPVPESPAAPVQPFTLDEALAQKRAEYAASAEPYPVHLTGVQHFTTKATTAPFTMAAGVVPTHPSADLRLVREVTYAEVIKWRAKVWAANWPDPASLMEFANLARQQQDRAPQEPVAWNRAIQAAADLAQSMNDNSPAFIADAIRELVDTHPDADLRAELRLLKSERAHHTELWAQKTNEWRERAERVEAERDSLRALLQECGEEFTNWTGFSVRKGLLERIRAALKGTNEALAVNETKDFGRHQCNDDN
jgi:hypothetical protein